MLTGHRCECDLGEDDPSETLVTCSAPGGWPLIGKMSSARVLIGRGAGDTLSSSGRDQQFYRAMRGEEQRTSCFSLSIIANVNSLSTSKVKV